MTVINTNVKALFAQNALQINNRSITSAMQQLFTGKRINSSVDNAAGMAIASRMTQNIQSLDQAVRNAGDAISLIQTTEGATNEITNMLQRMRELSVQSSNDTNSADQRGYLDLEFQQLKQQIVQIANNTEWNGFPVLNCTAGQQVGPIPLVRATANGEFSSLNSPLASIAAGDVTINGVAVPPSSTFADIDTKSSADAAASAIAKAAAINSISAQTGVTAVIGSTVMSGSAMSGSSVSAGQVVINGFISPWMSTVAQNNPASRAEVVKIINSMQTDTGVLAIDTGSDATGVRLQAMDGRNIEVTFVDSNDADFAANTRLKEGGQSGSYSLEAKIDSSMSIASVSGNISNAGLLAGSYDNNVAAVSTGTREGVALSALAPAASVRLQAGDLVINGVAIPASSPVSSMADVQAGYFDASSASAIAAAINSQLARTGVTAEVDPISIVGTIDTNVAAVTSVETLVINNVQVGITVTSGDSYTTRQNALVAAVNDFFIANDKYVSGVVAKVNGNGQGVTLTAIDGRDITVYCTAPELLGLGSDRVKTTALAALTLAGGIRLCSSIPDSPLPLALPGLAPPMDGRIHVDVGVNGFGDDSHFTALGFSEGTYGGTASADMLPPKVGRMSFQVGASAGQTVNIDLADFGANGTITGAITSDAGEATPTIGIDTAAAAAAMLNTLDDVMNNVNQARANMGAVMNRLTHVIDNLTNISTNMSQSRSQIEDADYAKASSDLARSQIIQQAATAVLAQANTSQQTVLKLLQ